MKVLIATYLEPEHVETIANNDVDVLYEPELLPKPRYQGDHKGAPHQLTAPQQQAWDTLLAQAEVSYDFDWQAPAELPQRAPALRWVQATSAGIGTFMQQTGLDRTKLIATTAAGVHGLPLAEFALAGALHFAKGFPQLKAWQRQRHWELYTASLLAGRTVTVVGMGSIGKEVARLFTALQTNVIEITRTTPVEQALPKTDILILCCPLTAETENLIGPAQLAQLPPQAILINLARGRVVDEEALIAALATGKLAGACLDVFHTEPLPPDSPLWTMDNVIISPHSASTVATENAAITDLFVDNLNRYRAGTPLRNVYDPQRGY